MRTRSRKARCLRHSLARIGVHSVRHGRNFQRDSSLIRPVIAAATLVALVVPAALSAQVITSERRPTTSTGRSYGPATPGQAAEPECRAGETGDEIVVCGIWQEDDRFRVESTRQTDPDSREARKDSIPAAPDLGPPPCKPSLLSLCVKPGEPGPGIYLIDFEALPDAPEGSDADRIAKGEMPTP